MQIRRVEHAGRVFRIPPLPVLESRHVEVDEHAEAQVHEVLLKLQEWLVREGWQSLIWSGGGCQGGRLGPSRRGPPGCVGKTTFLRPRSREEILTINILL